jgi:hypothetical protein
MSRVLPVDVIDDLTANNRSFAACCPSCVSTCARAAGTRANVRQSILRVRRSAFLPHRDLVRGFVYDVDTDELREVHVDDAAEAPGSFRARRALSALRCVSRRAQLRFCPARAGFSGSCFSACWLDLVVSSWMSNRRERHDRCLADS